MRVINRFGALLCLPLALFSQVVIETSKLPGANAAPAAAAGHGIKLDVIATDKSGKPVSGLQQTDFTVFDDKRPVKLTSFHAEGAPAEPLEIILLVDNVNSPFAQIAQVRDQVRKYLNRATFGNPISIAFLTDTGLSGLPASRNAAELIEGLDKTALGLRTITRAQGVYGAVDRFQISLRALAGIAEMEKQRPGRKMLIWISAGWPLLSGPGVQLTRKEQKELFNSIAATSTALRQARIVLDSVDPIGVIDAGTIRTTWYKDFLKGVKMPKNVDPGDLSLQVLASQSGGRVMNSGNDLSSEITSCVADAAAWYVMSFDAAPADGPNEYHSLEVKIERPGVTARTRAGYYNQP